MNDQLQRCQVHVDASLREAMIAIDRGACEIALVVDQAAKLVGVMTDGDVRRALLHKGATMESGLKDFMQREFRSARASSGRAEILDLMRALTIDQVPIVDAEGKLCGLHLLHEMLGPKKRPNAALIMAGGKGMRLRPITEHVPKPMIMVAGRPILERIVLHVVSFGIRRIFLSINYLGHIIEEHFGDGSRFGCQIEYLREEQPLGTGGALRLLPPGLNDSILVMNGDVVTQADLGAMIDYHHERKHIATMAVREYTHQIPFGCVEASNGKITELEEKPTFRKLINTGIYVLSPSLIEHVPGNSEFPITQLFNDCLNRDELVGAYPLEGDWIDVGQMDQLKQAREGKR